ncbi:hypothetical protein EYD10_02851 [Varanus komodoensis]|nr:hypothetical protein EYD10_02851 [Varanus komodoensis]
MWRNPVASKIRYLQEYHNRVLHNIYPVPSGTDIANTLKYFSQTLLRCGPSDIAGLQLPISPSQQSQCILSRTGKKENQDASNLTVPMTMCLFPVPFPLTPSLRPQVSSINPTVTRSLLYSVLRDAPTERGQQSRDAQLSDYPSLDYQGLYVTLVTLLDLVPLLQHGQHDLGQSIFYTTTCLLPFLNDDILSTLPYTMISTLATFPPFLHKDIIEYLSTSFLPMAICPWTSYFQLISKDILLEMGSSRREGVPAHVNLSASSMLMIAMQYTSNPVYHCQLLECLMKYKQEVWKMCIDPSLSVALGDKPPPLYLCEECSQRIAGDHSEWLIDVLLPQAEISAICQKKNCSSHVRRAVVTCFSAGCCGRHGNRPVRYCKRCHSNHHSSEVGATAETHLYQTSPPPINTRECGAEELVCTVEAVISLLKEAEFHAEQREHELIRRRQLGLSSSHHSLDNTDFDNKDDDKHDQRLLSQFGIWFLVSLCTPSENTPTESLARLVSMVFQWFHSTAYMMDDEVGSLVEKLKPQFVTKWLKTVCDVRFDVMVMCLLPKPMEFARVGGYWDKSCSTVTQLKEGLNRILCLIPYNVINQPVWDCIMPEWLEAIRTEVPDNQLKEFREVLSVNSITPLYGPKAEAVWTVHNKVTILEVYEHPGQSGRSGQTNFWGNGLDEVMGWMRANKLKLNPDKTEVLLVGGSGFGEGELNLVLNGVALPLRDKVRSLGVLLDPELSLEAQVTAVARSAFLQLRLIHQLRPYLENDCLATVTHALVTSRLDFCNALYVGLPLKTVRILQLVQNRAARLLMGTGRYVHMTPVLRQLHWLPIEVRAQFKVLVMTYKALNGLGPGYLKERLHPYMPSRPLRLAGEALLREPSMEEVRRVLSELDIVVPLQLLISMFSDGVNSVKELANQRKSRVSELTGNLAARRVSIASDPGRRVQHNTLSPFPSPFQSPFRSPVRSPFRSPFKNFGHPGGGGKTIDFDCDDEEMNLNCFILMFDLILKQMELQDDGITLGLENSISKDIISIINNVFQAPWGGSHTCQKDEKAVECNLCQSSILCYQLACELLERLAPKEEIRLVEPTDNLEDSLLYSRPEFLIGPEGEAENKSAPKHGENPGNHTEATENTAAIKNDTERKFCYQQLPVTLKLIYTILQEMARFEEPDILFNMLNCLKILCLHGECLYIAKKDHPQFLAYIQDNMLIASLWRIVKSEFSQLSSLAVPLLLHALSLPHGADIFWTIINGNFNSKDWKIRFEAGDWGRAAGRVLGAGTSRGPTLVN